MHEVVLTGVFQETRPEPGRAHLELLDRCRGDAGRRALRHGNRGRHDGRLHRGEEVEARPAAEHHPAGQDQRRHTDGGGQIPPPQPELQARLVDLSDEQLEPVGEQTLEPPPHTGGASPLQVGQVGRQDPERLDEGKEQARDHDQRNDAEDLPHHARHEQQRHEGGDGRQHREDDRLGDLLRALDRPAEPVAMLLLMPEDVLADDDGVVDDDAEHRDKREQRHDVDGDVETRHQGDRAEERDWDPETDPEREAQIEKEGERDEDQREPGRAGAQHQRQPGAQHLCRVLPDRQRDTGGEARLCLLDIVIDQRGDLERALFAGPEDGDHHRRCAVEASDRRPRYRSPASARSARG